MTPTSNTTAIEAFASCKKRSMRDRVIIKQWPFQVITSIRKEIGGGGGGGEVAADEGGGAAAVEGGLGAVHQALLLREGPTGFQPYNKPKLFALRVSIHPTLF